MLIDELVRFAETLDDQWHSPVADAAAECWNLQRPVFLRSSACHVFVARKAGESPRVVLRMRPARADSAAVLERGARAAQGWRRVGAPFVDAVPSGAGRLVERVAGYVVTALTVAEGESLEESTLGTASAHSWGAALARLHRVELTSSGLPSAEGLIDGDFDNEVAAASSTVRDRLRVLPRHADVYGVLHGDAEPDNVVVTSAGMVLVDPDEVRVGWYISDIAFALRDWGDQTGRLDWARTIPAAVLAGYRSVRPVTVEELSWVPLLVRAAALEDLIRLQPHLRQQPGAQWPDWAIALDDKVRARAAALRMMLRPNVR
jgi:Ser/Thr protein kinase RdoA (MazF antagonist)